MVTHPRIVATWAMRADLERQAEALHAQIVQAIRESLNTIGAGGPYVPPDGDVVVRWCSDAQIFAWLARNRYTTQSRFTSDVRR